MKENNNKKCSSCPLLMALLESIYLKRKIMKCQKIKSTEQLFEEFKFNLN